MENNESIYYITYRIIVLPTIKLIGADDDESALYWAIYNCGQTWHTIQTKDQWENMYGIRDKVDYLYYGRDNFLNEVSIPVGFKSILIDLEYSNSDTKTFKCVYKTEDMKEMIAIVDCESINSLFVNSSYILQNVR